MNNATPTRYLAKCRACACVTSALTAGNHCHRDQSDPARDGGVFTFSPAKGQPLPWPATSGGFAIVCRKCGQPRNATAVRGKYSAKHVCGARCMASTGPSCECSCGGKNHGSSYAA